MAFFAVLYYVLAAAKRLLPRNGGHSLPPFQANMASFTYRLLLSAGLLVLSNSCTSSPPDDTPSQPPTAKLPATAASMVLVPGGSFSMGSNDPAFPDASPVHEVQVKPFLLDEHEVTNAEFAVFVAATQYVTVAEQKPSSEEFPDVPAARLVAGSAVFAKPERSVSLADPAQWWRYVAGANWRHPLGPNSSIAGHDNDPVVQVCYDDALAYARWAGKRLPTEAEWECAARAGKSAAAVYYWGEELAPGGQWMANIFQGDFPVGNTLADGFAGVAPVKSFPPNSLGLYDMDGNVWEWCNDYYRPDYYLVSPVANPPGPPDSYDPEEPGLVKRVQRGGSFLCSDQYCIRYKAGSRGKGEVRSASNNLGFRCAKDVKQ